MKKFQICSKQTFFQQNTFRKFYFVAYVVIPVVFFLFFFFTYENFLVIWINNKVLKIQKKVPQDLTSHSVMMSGKENSRLKQIKSHLKQKYRLPESCFSITKKKKRKKLTVRTKSVKREHGVEGNG